MEELSFWTGIMRDHTEFISTSLSSKEMELIRTAEYFKNTWMAIRNEVKGMEKDAPAAKVNSILSRTMTVLVNFIQYKRILLNKSLTCKIEISLPPTFINHMINEAMEFYRTLWILQSNQPLDKTAETLRLHKIWVPDAAGHAASIASGLDPIESMLIKEAEGYKKTFDDMTIKVMELGQMLERAGLKDGTLEEFNEEVVIVINSFICYLGKILELKSKCKVLAIFKPLTPDHMAREENYYLTKLGVIHAEVGV